MIVQRNPIYNDGNQFINYCFRVLIGNTTYENNKVMGSYSSREIAVNFNITLEV